MGSLRSVAIMVVYWLREEAGFVVAMATTEAPAARPALRPLKESSKTMQSAGDTPSFEAASR